jgi:hypothetical protein
LAVLKPEVAPRIKALQTLRDPVLEKLYQTNG